MLFSEKRRSENGNVLSFDYQLEDFEFHDSNWKLVSRNGDTVTFEVTNLNIHKGTEQNDEDWYMELGPARMTFRGFRLIHFEPGRSWTTDETGHSLSVGPRILYSGEEGMARLAEEPFQVFHFEREGDHWEIGCCGVEPYFTLEFDFESVEITWDSYAKKAWYELHRCYRYTVMLDTPKGPEQGELDVHISEEDAYNTRLRRMVKGPSVSVGLKYAGTQYWGDGTDDYLWIDTVADLQKKLPVGVTIRGCLTCRHGNLCPYGNEPGKVFCLKDTPLSGKMGVAALSDNHKVWTERKKAYFDCCGDWMETSDDFYTYNDYRHYLMN